jgi:cardiolipin synthase C
MKKLHAPTIGLLDRLLLLIILITALGSLASIAPLQPRPDMPLEIALAPGEEAPLDRLIAPRETQHAGQSAFRLVSSGLEAFAIRARSARLATRSLDVQTFIWHSDLTGRLLAHQLLEAADRGVRVRLLVDGMDARHDNAGFAALAAHRNVAVRIFNPLASRQGVLELIAGGLLDFERINHRMHNKTWIADNRVAIVGGRNIGDEYFGASDAVSFVDLDFAMIGPIVRDASTSFDKYWNSPSAYPIETLDPVRVNAQALAALRFKLDEAAAATRTSRFADALRADDAVQRLATGDLPMQWSARYQFTADDPLKVTMSGHDLQRAQVRRTLLPAVQKAQADIVLISPYFVPGETITAFLGGVVKTGRRVRVLTNSLVATDVGAVHGGYSRYRKTLLEGGVELWELKPADGGETKMNLPRSSGASLHSKAIMIDRKTVFVGSYNLDPRSAWLNCEQGVLVESETLAQETAAIFARQITGEHAWHVTLARGDLSWTDGAETFSEDPHASIGQRLQARIVQLLRLDAQL